MNQADLLALVSDWLEFQVTPRDTDDSHRLLWAFDRVYDLCNDAPDEAWQFILAALRADTSITTMESLSAGPLEDLLATHGARVIERVEQEARTNPAFASLLGGVWQSAMPDDLWKRVQAVWDRRAWNGSAGEEPV